jgi:hypothetical protein
MRSPELTTPRNQPKRSSMSDVYIVQAGGHTAGIVVRDHKTETFSFFAATHKFNALEGLQFKEPHAAERAARQLIAKPKPLAETQLGKSVA